MKTRVKNWEGTAITLAGIRELANEANKYGLSFDEAVDDNCATSTTIILGLLDLLEINGCN